MNKEAILNFIKKNVLSLICAFVAIVAIVLVFYPLGGMVTALKTEADEHAQMFSTLNGFVKSRKLPISDPFKTDAGDLKSFPNSATIAAGQAANKKWADYSTQMLKDLQEMNQKNHDLLIPDELPNPKYETTLFRFSQLYKLLLSTDTTATSMGDATVAPPISPEPTLASHNAMNLRNDVLHGGTPPIPKEIDDAKAALWQNVYAQQVYTQNGKALNLTEVQAAFTEEALALPLKMKNEVATKHKMYVEKDAFTVSPAITLDVKPQLVDVWYAQLSLWMQQDLAAAIAEANADSKNILDAEVKRLISMQIPIPPAQLYTFPPPAGGAQAGGITDLPSTAIDTAPLPSIFSVSPTGRYSNGMYDVAKFKLVVDVDAARVNQFIETMSHDRLISVYLENEYALNSETESSKGYLYGPGSTVRLQLEGEILFMRNWTTPLMPDRIKMALGLMVPPAGGIPGGGGFGAGGPPPGMPPGFGGPGGPVWGDDLK